MWVSPVFWITYKPGYSPTHRTQPEPPTHIPAPGPWLDRLLCSSQVREVSRPHLFLSYPAPLGAAALALVRVWWVYQLGSWMILATDLHDLIWHTGLCTETDSGSQVEPSSSNWGTGVSPRVPEPGIPVQIFASPLCAHHPPAALWGRAICFPQHSLCAWEPSSQFLGVLSVGPASLSSKSPNFYCKILPKGAFLWGVRLLAHIISVLFLW